MRRIRDALRSRSLATVLIDERGSVTAEFAITLPVVGAVLVLCVAAVGLSAQQLRLSAVAAEMSRAEARGESQMDRLLSAFGYPVSVQRTRQGDVHCILLSANPGGGALAEVTISASSCALVSALA